MSNNKDKDKDVQCSMSITEQEGMKAFVSTLQFLHKVGKDLLFEVEQNALILRALNDGKTAYASMEFESHFFSRGIFLKEDLESFSCKVNLKQLCAVCKSFRSVERLFIKAERVKDNFELVLEMTTSNTGVVRTHRFKYSDCDVLSAVFEDAGASSLKSSHKIFTQLLEHMYQSPEIAIDAAAEHFKVRSYHSPKDADQEARKHLTTDLNVDIEDFDFYDCKPIDEQSSQGALSGAVAAPGADEADPARRNELIFCIREMKAILNLCDAIGVEHIQLSFTTSGNPIKFLATGEHFTAQVIMTTILPRVNNISHGHGGVPSAPSTQSSSASRGVPSANSSAASGGKGSNNNKRSANPSERRETSSKERKTTSRGGLDEEDEEEDRRHETKSREQGSRMSTNNNNNDDDDDDDEGPLTTNRKGSKGKTVMDDDDDDDE